MTNNTPAKYTWIIGASTGIGEALATELDQRGEKLCLSARNAERLQALNLSLGDRHLIFPLDVTKIESLNEAASFLQEQWPRIDRIIFMAALYTPMTIDTWNMPEIEKIIQVNLLGAFHVAHIALPWLKSQGYGQLAMCGSVAGYRGLPNSQPYAATKAALINLTQSMRVDTPRSIDIKLISPGFVETQLTQKNNFKMPFIISPPTAAKAIADGLDQKAFEIHFPKIFTFLLKIIAILPNWLYFALFSKKG
jgi:short-subunit dehydrogenase